MQWASRPPVPSLSPPASDLGVTRTVPRGRSQERGGSSAGLAGPGLPSRVAVTLPSASLFIRGVHRVGGLVLGVACEPPPIFSGPGKGGGGCSGQREGRRGPSLWTSVAGEGGAGSWVAWGGGRAPALDTAPTWNLRR